MDNLSYLYTPSVSIINPPIDPTIDEVPIEKLSWEDFEKLCLRIAETYHSIDDCEIYGTKGQKQDGIDIFAIKENNKYSSYQCKRYENVTEDVLEEAVNRFKAGDWLDKSDQFVFCTTFPLNKTQLQKKFNKIKKQLKIIGIEFNKWDKVQLNRILKKHPKIVFDFFGKEWVKKFNGESKLNELESYFKLDSNQVVNYRKELFNIYSTVFQQFDPSIPSSELNDFSILLQERFIVPDFYDKKSFDEANIYDETEYDNEEEDERLYSLDTPDNSFRRFRDKEKYEKTKLKIDARINVDSVLPLHDRTMILGEPGSGKSTLLHYIILDLLASKPQLENIAKNWGKLLPIWLPFAFITKNLNNDPNLSISELLRMWFKSIDKEFVFEIVKYALEDNRLLLVVDGIDEWTNSVVAKQAISRIEIQSQLAHAKVIYSSRPYGYKHQRDSFSKIQEFNIAPFSETQQREFISYWYKKWMLHINHTDPDFVNNETDDFLTEIKKSSDFIKLAGNPLLLSILISQRFKYSVLPKNKIKALITITEHLINHHPIRRRISANIIEEDDLDFEISEIFSVLAIYIQKECQDGVIAKKDAQKVIVEYLIDFMDYEIPKAKKVSKSLLDIGANKIGIIIEKSSEEVAFMHRQFQEFMAAKYLFESDKGIVEEHIKSYANNPHWNQVITFFFGQIPNMRKKDFGYYISLIKVDKNERLSYSHFLKYSLVLNQSNSPVNIAKEYLQDITHKFEFETNFTYKSILWDIILDSTFNNKLKPDVVNFLFKYYPNYYKFDDYRLKSLRSLFESQLTQPVREFIIKSLINGNSHQKIDASYTAQKFITDKWIFQEILKIFDTCSNPEILSYTINSIISEKIDFETKKKYFNKFQNTEHSKVFLFNLKLKIDLKLHTDEDLKLFIKSQRNFDYTLEEEALNIFINGWSDSNSLLDTSLKSINKHYFDNKIDSNIAWKVLFHCFNKEERVIKRITEELKNEQYPFLSMDTHRGWSYISNYFRDNEELIPEIDNWIRKQEFHEPDIAYACLVGRTENNKKYLLDNLPKSNIPHWYVMALVEGWSNDSTVNEALKRYFKSEIRNTFYAANFVSNVFKSDIAEGIEVLEKIIFNRELYFRDRAIQPLIELDKKYFEESILEKFLANEINLLSKGDFGQYYNALMSIVNNFYELDIVKNFVTDHLSNDVTLLDIFIRHYPDQIEKINDLICLSQPLDVEFRLKLVEGLSNKNIGNEATLSQLSLFPKEKEEIIRASAAVNYFNYLKVDRSDEIIEYCKENVFYRGHDVDVQRQISFCGYLITKKLPEYFQLKDSDSNSNANPRFTFDTSYREMSPSIVKLLINNFDYLFTEIGDKFEKLTRFSSNDNQNIWGFWAKYSDNSSPSYSYIINYIKSNADTIKNLNLIDFLRRTSSQSILLKNILLNIINNNKDNIAIFCGQILGENFREDNEVYNTVCDIHDYLQDSGKIIAMCNGWPKDKILKEIFDKVVKDGLLINPIVEYNFKFLFRDINNIMEFFNNVFENYNRAKYEHGRFIKPLYKRIISDEILQEEIKKKLLKASSISEKVSFYSILSSINKIDKDILEWKSTQLSQESKDDYGYNILTNKISSVTEVLDEIYY